MRGSCPVLYQIVDTIPPKGLGTRYARSTWPVPSAFSLAIVATACEVVVSGNDFKTMLSDCNIDDTDCYNRNILYVSAGQKWTNSNAGSTPPIGAQRTRGCPDGAQRNELLPVLQNPFYQGEPRLDC